MAWTVSYASHQAAASLRGKGRVAVYWIRSPETRGRVSRSWKYQWSRLGPVGRRNACRYVGARPLVDVGRVGQPQNAGDLERVDLPVGRVVEAGSLWLVQPLAHVVDRPPVAVRDLADERAERLPEQGVLQEVERLAVGGVERGPDQPFGVAGVPAAEQFPDGVLPRGAVDVVGGGGRVDATQPVGGAGEQVREERVSFQVGGAARIRGQPHPEVVQQERPAQDERLGGVQRKPVAADL